MQEFIKVDDSLLCEFHATIKKQLFSHEMKSFYAVSHNALHNKLRVLHVSAPLCLGKKLNRNTRK